MIVWIIAAGIVLAIAFFILGFRIVREEERWVIELLGRYFCTLRPGLNWVFPFITKIRAVVSVWEQSINLFPENPNIDFKGGGTAQLINAKVWLVVRDPYKAIYNVENWRKAVQARIENLMRDYLSNQSVEEIIDQESIHPWWELIKTNLQKQKLPENPEQEILDNWGIQITKITIEDFKWSEEVVKTRKEVFEAQREIEREKNLSEAAIYKSRKKAQESGGMHGEIVRLLMANYKYNYEDATKIASELVVYFKGAEEKVLRDWRGGALESVIERIAETLKLKQ